MSSDNQPGRGAIWNVRDLVGDLADELPPHAQASAPRASARPITATGTTSFPRAGGTDDDSAEHTGDIAIEAPTTRAVEPPRRGKWVTAEEIPANTSGTSMRTVTMLAGIALLALLVIVVAVAVTQDGGTQPGTSSANTIAPEPRGLPFDGDGGRSTDRASEEPTTSPTAVTDPEDDALLALRELNGQDLPTVPLDGRYVAQLASKTVGIVDPYQTAENGSHTFYAQDILAEHSRLRQMFTGETRVVLLLSTDYGRQQLHEGQPLWVTFALVPDSSKEGVAAWCAAQFASLSAETLENQCAPRRLNPRGTSAS